MSAIGCFFMFRLFSLFHTLRTAFLLSLAFATTTFFWAYSKSAYDVLGACVGVCVLLYLSARILGKEQVQNRMVLLTGSALTLAGSFRYSLAPFLVLSVLALFYFARPKVTWQHVMLFLLVVFVGMIPTFIYNFVRSGSFLIPTLAVGSLKGSLNPDELGLAQAQWQQSLTGSIGDTVQGLFWLMLSPNMGLFVHAPILLLLFAVPFVWKGFPSPARRLILSFSIGTILYVLLISSLRFWSGFSWGPRYLLPILPILFFAVGMMLVSLWDKYKYPLMGLILLSFVLNAAPALVNWNLAIYNDSRAEYGEDALFPYQHAAVWNGLYLGVQGEPLPLSEDLSNDPVRSGAARFPDLWTFRLMEYSTTGLLAGLIILLALLGATLKSFVKLTVSRGRGLRPMGQPP
jgi:hypothetical protein